MEKTAGEGTRDYLSPEMHRCLLGDEVTIDYFKSDVFSLGVTMLHLAKLSLPSAIPKFSKDPQELTEAVRAETSGLAYSDNFLMLLKLMLVSDPTQRLTFEQLLSESRVTEISAVGGPMLDLRYKQKIIKDVLREWREHISNQKDMKSLNLQELLVFALRYEEDDRYQEYSEIAKEILLNYDNAIEVITMYKAVLWSDLSYKYWCQSNNIESEAAHSKALEFSDKIHTVSNQYLDLLYLNLGDDYVRQGKYEEAERMFQKSLVAALEVSGENEAVILASTGLAFTYLLANKYDLGEELCVKSIAIYTKLFGEPAIPVTPYYILSSIYNRQKRHSEWKEMDLRLNHMVRKYCGNSLRHANYLCQLGVIYDLQGRETEAETLLQEAVSIYQRKEHQNYISPLVSTAYLRLGIICNRRHRPMTAENLFIKAAEVHLKTSFLSNLDLGRIYNELGAIYTKNERFDEAHSILLKALSIRETMQGKNPRDNLSNLAEACFKQEKWSECERYLIQAIKALEQQDISLQNVAAHIMLGKTFQMQGKLIDAEAAFVKSINSLKKFGETQPQHPYYTCILADIYHAQGRFSEAEEIFTLAIEEIKSQPDKDIIFTSVRLREMEVFKEHISKAEEVLKLSVDIIERNPGKFEAFSSDAYNILANILIRQEKWAESERYYIRYLELVQKSMPEYHLKHSLGYHQLANMYLMQGKLFDAETAIMKGLNTLTQHFGETHPAFPKSYCLLADIYYSQGRFSESEEIFVSAIDKMKSRPNEYYSLLIFASVQLSEIYVSKNKYSEAGELLIFTVDLVGRNPGKFNEYIPAAFRKLAKVYFEQGKLSESEQVYAQCLEFLQKNIPEEPFLGSLCYKELAITFICQGKFVDAERVCVKAIEILLEHFGETNPSFPGYCCILAHIYYSQGRLSEAKAVYVRVTNEMKQVPDAYGDLIKANFALSDIYQKEGKYFEAERALISAIDMIQTRPEEGRTNLKNAYLLLGAIYFEQGRYEEIEPLLRISLEMHIQLHGERNIEAAIIYHNFSVICVNSNRLLEGEELLLKAIEIAKELPDQHESLAAFELLKENLEMQIRNS